MEIEMISCENVKPSSPTPTHLQNYKFSMFDQTMPASIRLPLVLYFANTGSTTSANEDDDMVSRKTDHLKASLSLTLTRFYPVAGRASVDCQSIDCNDEGVPFSVVNIKGPHKLSDPSLWHHLFPFPMRIDYEWSPGCNVAMIRVTHFECGAVAIGVVFWHKVVDTVTIASFLKYWSATARGFSGTDPNYSIRSLFPPKEELRKPSVDSLQERYKFGCRIYVFDGPAIRKLKAGLSSNAVDSPSRVEVVTALLWKCYMAASLANHHDKDNPPVASAITHVVNLRRRTRPPLPSEYFGNMTDSVVALFSNTDYNNIGNYDDEHDLLRLLVKEIRDATSKIDDDYVNRMRGDQWYSGLCENRKLIWGGIPDGADCLSFTSWCGMGFYDMDFGQGKPMWMTVKGSAEEYYASHNTVLLMDTKPGDGVVAFVSLKETYMKVFENDEQLNNLASGSSLYSD